jgi:hypothetical protein
MFFTLRTGIVVSGWSNPFSGTQNSQDNFMPNSAKDKIKGRY